MDENTFWVGSNVTTGQDDVNTLLNVKKCVISGHGKS